MSYSNLVLAYHGCDITLRDELLAGLKQLKPSNNPYDWLGPGIYFYEADPERALEHASTVSNHPERFLSAAAIATPAVIGVALNVSRWLDMSTRVALQEFEIAAKTCREGFASKGTPVNANRPAFEGDEDNLRRPFDKQTFTLLHGMRELEYNSAIKEKRYLDAAELRPYQAVRSAFTQGKSIAGHSEFGIKNHTQIALIDSGCIKGYFIPVGQPTMQAPSARETSLELLAQAKRNLTSLKPRKRPTP